MVIGNLAYVLADRLGHVNLSRSIKSLSDRLRVKIFADDLVVLTIGF